jgi:hypothetical protein
MRAALLALALAVSSANATLPLCEGSSGCTIQGDEGVLVAEHKDCSGGDGRRSVTCLAAAWLFGILLLVLAGMSRKRRQIPD